MMTNLKTSFVDSDFRKIEEKGCFAFEKTNKDAIAMLYVVAVLTLDDQN